MVDRLVNSEANARRISNVENCFGSSGQPLAIPGRVLVGEGVLVKICRKKPKARQFFLFNDILVYGNIVIAKRKFNKQHVIPLDTVRLDNLEDEGELRNGWLIKTPTKSFAVYAATSTEKREWMIHIDRCVNELLLKSGKSPTTVHAAVWVPDNEAPVCMHCKKTQFTVFQRRHHCRKCGSVVCGPCSNKRFLLPHQSNKPLRVCLTCFQTLAGTPISVCAPAAAAAAAAASSPASDNKYFEHGNPETSGEEDSSDDDDDKTELQTSPPEEPTFYDSKQMASVDQPAMAT
ncbi:hypothetical protein M514_10394 [Trichuris suis]|uniref:FYVE zinc finger n=1 Tax=Trichuris suis TaxID=68888 RepID=A0A085NEI7_9BILA|nr:hypothetical protein M513_10394 [Trichuris suis]KFD67883.1 hypothetical protein M514_10394 [Trichuris suis]